ncbi:MAG: hypothetical protein QM754_10710 [Tepidisphaeraceae bacterium]
MHPPHIMGLARQYQAIDAKHAALAERKAGSKKTAGVPAVAKATPTAPAPKTVQVAPPKDDSPEARADYVARHEWANMNAADREPWIDERAYVGWRKYDLRKRVKHTDNR